MARYVDIDKYKNFEIRGNHYKEIVSHLGELDGIPVSEL